MPNEAFEWMGRVKRVEREYGAIRFATDYLLKAVNDDPSVLNKLVHRPDINTAHSHLEGTYIIRVFAEFETALRCFVTAFHLRKPTGTEVLINRVRDRARIPQSYAHAAHLVRLYRNALVHERTTSAQPVTMRESTSSLCTFLSRLQRIW